MVESFPQLYRQALGEYGQVFAITDSTLFRKIDSLKTKDDAAAFVREHHLFDPLNEDPAFNHIAFDIFGVADVTAIRELTQKAIEWLAIAENPKASYADIESAGISVSQTEFIGPYLHFSVSVDAAAVGHLGDWQRIVSEKDDEDWAEVIQVLRAEYGIDPTDLCGYTPKGNTLWCLHEGDAEHTLSAFIGTGPLEEQAANYMALACADALASFHMADVATLVERASLIQEAQTFAAAVWVSFAHAVEGNRAITCKACGRPLLVSGDRGKPREFCDATCRKWWNRNKGTGRKRESSAILK